MKGSYVSTEFSMNVADEIRRLGKQVDLFWKKESELYLSLGLASHIRILEVGSGPGYYIKKLSEIFPEASFTSMEMDSSFVEFQRTLFSEGLVDKVKIIQGNLEGLPAEVTGYDLIIARLVIEHVQKPSEIVAELTHLLNENGKLVLIDNDFENHLRTFPRIEELNQLYKAYCGQRLEEGGHPYIGRQLPVLLRNSGLEDIHFDSICVHSLIEGSDLFLGAESSAVGLMLVKKGFLSKEIFDALSRKWSEMITHSDHLLMRELYYAVGTRGSGNRQLQTEEKTSSNFASNSPGETLPPLNSVEDWSAILWYYLENIEKPEVLDEINKQELVDCDSFDLGIDSLAVVDLSVWLEKNYSIKIEITELLQASTVIGYLSSSSEITSSNSNIDSDHGEI